MIEIPQAGLRQFIRELAARHGIKSVPTEREQFALNVTRMSECDAETEEMMLLLSKLQRAGIVSQLERAKMFDRYINEK